MKYDVIGDIHGCYDEMIALIEKLGYSLSSGFPVHPENRTLVFLGDLTDRGPKSLEVVEFVGGTYRTAPSSTARPTNSTTSSDFGPLSVKSPRKTSVLFSG